MDDRLVFHAYLENLYPSLKIYFRPPSKLIIEYPCIVYEVKDHKAIHSGNEAYVLGTEYQATVMSELPGLENARRMLTLPQSKFERAFISDDIVHEVFSVRVKAI